MDGLEPLPELKCTRCPWSSNLDTDFQGLMAVRGAPFFTQPLSRPPRPACPGSSPAAAGFLPCPPPSGQPPPRPPVPSGADA